VSVTPVGEILIKASAEELERMTKELAGLVEDAPQELLGIKQKVNEIREKVSYLRDVVAKQMRP